MEFLRNSKSSVTLASLLILLFLAPMISPVISASGETSARASPNFTVVSLTLDGAGSVQDGTETFVENNTHVARIVVGNSGSATGSVIVTLVHRGSPTAGESIVGSVSICLLYTSPSPRDKRQSRMPSSA